MAPFTFDSPASLMQIPGAVNPSMLYDTVCHSPEWETENGSLFFYPLPIYFYSRPQWGPSK